MRTTLLGEAGRARARAEAARIAEEAGERARKRRRPELPAWARDELARFHAHVLYELLGLRELVFATPEDDVGHALRLCLSSILVKFMKAGPEAPRDGEAKRIARGIPSRMLADRAAELARGLAALERRAPPGTPAPRVLDGPTRASCRFTHGSAALVLSSPPYAGTYDYAAQHDVALHLARAAARTLPPRAARRARERDRRRHARVWRADASGAGSARSRACCARAATRCWWSATAWSTGAPRTRPTASRRPAPPVGLEPIARASQARPIHDRRAGGDLRRPPAPRAPAAAAQARPLAPVDPRAIAAPPFNEEGIG